MLELALFGKLTRRVDHVESHSSLAGDERRLHMIYDCCIFKDALSLIPRA